MLVLFCGRGDWGWGGGGGSELWSTEISPAGARGWGEFVSEPWSTKIYCGGGGVGGGEGVLGTKIS